MSYRFLRNGRVTAGTGLAGTLVLAAVGFAGAAPASSDAVAGRAQSPIDLRERDITLVDELPRVRSSIRAAQT
jgi:hypothetical protein